ncbi:MAG TPA: zinc ribbon domain-containing protein [Solirubrobacterales bacterium]|nr:zinc ribbon domain-containing protein [Solirubrobacterales bacterium]
MSDACPSCGSQLAPDQRYCLHCGQRRGDPRLPVMDAVTFMEASRRPAQPQAAGTPAPPSGRRRLISANTSMVAAVATLVLAMGVGVLIGRSGDGSSTAATPAPQIIRVGGGATETASAATAGGKSSAAGGKQPKAANVKKAKEKASTGASGASKATEEVYEPAAGVKIAPPEQELGGECDPSVAGCGDSGKFEGTFFE